MTKQIMLLQATSTRNPDKIKLLLANESLAHVAGDLMSDDYTPSEEVTNIVAGATVQRVTWRWPGGSAHRNVCGVNGAMILSLLQKRGVPTTFDTVYANDQVPDEMMEDNAWQGRADNLEIVLEVSDTTYQELSEKYGLLAQV